MRRRWDALICLISIASVSAARAQTWWKPGKGTQAWQYQLGTTFKATDIISGVRIYDIDGFATTASMVQLIKSTGARAVCYISGGSWEDWRPDKGLFPACELPGVLGHGQTEHFNLRAAGYQPGWAAAAAAHMCGQQIEGCTPDLLIIPLAAAIGKPLDGWPGERWLDVRSQQVRAALLRRLDMCRAKGFDAVEGGRRAGPAPCAGPVRLMLMALAARAAALLPREALQAWGLELGADRWGVPCCS
jgi:hypothetical protein